MIKNNKVLNICLEKGMDALSEKTNASLSGLEIRKLSRFINSSNYEQHMQVLVRSENVKKCTVKIRFRNGIKEAVY
mgnify:CR=1 FL=1